MTDQDVLNPTPPKETDIVTGSKYYCIRSDIERGQPGKSSEKYRVEDFQSLGIRVIGRMTHVIMGRDDKGEEKTLPLNRVFLSEADALKVKPEDRNW